MGGACGAYLRRPMMQCNIDDRGAKYRRLWGMTNLVIAALAALLALWSNLWWVWIIAAVALVAGTLGLYEAKKKWCVMRALGVKTPM
jgi:hypothetical protein